MEQFCKDIIEYYNGGDSKRIDDVPAMKAEIIKHFEEVLEEEK
jgi:hypothetical protein